jgi:hypothetical protein
LILSATISAWRAVLLALSASAAASSRSSSISFRSDSERSSFLAIGQYTQLTLQGSVAGFFLLSGSGGSALCNGSFGAGDCDSCVGLSLRHIRAFRQDRILRSCVRFHTVFRVASSGADSGQV